TLVGLLIDQPLHQIVETLGQLRQIPGRGQTLSQPAQATVVLDAAGTPHRAATALRTYRSMKTGGRLWCVLAIDSGDTPGQLAEYGNLIERFADNGILTANVDSKPNFLAASHCVLDGVKRCAAMRIVADLRRAIGWAVSEARPGDTILVLGGIRSAPAHQQRTEIKQLTEWIESERRAKDQRSRSEIAPPEPTIFKISDYRSDD
ncbi:MAG: hypothetical protein MI861_20050, partial [Pirellulales bacterium]|nr:hypothetical protein [Pirellulales bacterium]